MNDNTSATLGLILIVVIAFFIGFAIGVKASNGVGYQKGQVDCINGIIKYHLVEQPNKESIWKLIKEGNE